MHIRFIEESLEVKRPTIWTDGKAEVGRVRKEKRRREKMQVREKLEKIAKHCVFSGLRRVGK